MHYPTLNTGASLTGAILAAKYAQHFAEAAPTTTNLIARAGHETSFFTSLKQAYDDDDDAGIDIVELCVTSIGVDYDVGDLPVEPDNGEEGYENAADFYIHNRPGCDVLGQMVPAKYGGTNDLFIDDEADLDLSELLCDGSMNIFCEEFDKNMVYVCQSVQTFCDDLPSVDEDDEEIEEEIEEVIEEAIEEAMDEEEDQDEKED